MAKEKIRPAIRLNTRRDAVMEVVIANRFWPMENLSVCCLDFSADRVQVLEVRIHMMMSWNRILSGLLAVIYIVTAIAGSGAEEALIVFGFVILPLACIWFGDAMGGYTGLTTSMAITKTSPGLMVCIAGWLLLLSPIIVAAIAIL